MASAEFRKKINMQGTHIHLIISDTCVMQMHYFLFIRKIYIIGDKSLKVKHIRMVLYCKKACSTILTLVAMLEFDKMRSA